MIKLIGIDMDETFLRRDKTYDVPLFKKLMVKIRQRQIVLVIASGNSYDKLQAFFDAEDLDYLYFAGDNGNFIVKGNQVLAINELSKEEVRRAMAHLSQEAGYHCLISTSKTAYVLGDMPQYVVDRFLKYNQEIVVVSSLDDVPHDEHIVKLAIMSEHSLLENKRMLRQLKQLSKQIEVVTSGDAWIDVYHKHGGKGSAIAFFQKRYGIKKTETMCFGDSLNDLSMMYEALFSMSMGNADSELSRISRYQIGDNQEQAVQHVLDKVLSTSQLSWLNAHKLPKTRYRLLRRLKHKYNC